MSKTKANGEGKNCVLKLTAEVAFFLFLPNTLSCKNGVMTPMHEVVIRCSNVLSRKQGTYLIFGVLL